MSAIAVMGAFPYAHPTVAEVDAREAAFDRAEALQKALRKAPNVNWDNVVGLSRDRAANSPSAAIASVLPTLPCPCCGARGWCGHVGRIAA